MYDLLPVARIGAPSGFRRYWIGFSTLKVIVGNMLLPAWLDHYPAKVAFSGQETRRPVTGERADNLMTPVRSLHRTRGCD
jgi:hypothetical protein